MAVSCDVSGLVACFIVLAASLTQASTSIYKQVYPDIEEESLNRSVLCDPRNETCPLFITLLMSFGGIYKSNGAIPGVQIALDEINRNSTMLPGYKLHYTLKDSNCSREVSLSSFYTQMLPFKLGMIESGCSVTTEPTAEAAYYFNLITQLSCVSSSPVLSNRVQYKSHFQLLASEVFLAYGYFSIVKKFGWRRVAIIAEDETLFTKIVDLVTEQLRAHKINHTITSFLPKEGVKVLGNRLFDPEARIFLLFMSPIHARELLCQAKQKKIYYPKYQFIVAGWYDDKWWVGPGDEEAQLKGCQCSVADRERVMSFMLTVTLDEFLKNNSTVVDSGNNGHKFYEDYNHLINTSTLEPHLEPLIYTQQCYDATWTLARALNTTLTALIDNETLNEQFQQFNSNLGPNDRFGLHHFTYNNSAMLDMIFNSITDIDFIGLTGQIRFNNDGVKRIQFVLVEQYRIVEGGVNKLKVGVVDIDNTSDLKFSYQQGMNDTNLWQHKQIPYDGVPRSDYVSTQTYVVVITSIITTVGLIFCVVCLIFNFMSRNSKLMKLSSLKLNYLILAGAALLYISTYFLTVPTTNPKTIRIFCNITPWMGGIGYSLCFGTIIMKMGRIFYIFNNVMSTAVKKTIHDWKLAIGVVILVTIDVVILGANTILNRNSPDVISVFNRENTQDEDGELGIITHHYNRICNNSKTKIAFTILYGFKFFLHVIAFIFAFSLRKVKVKGFDDSQFVRATVYITAVFTAIIIVNYFALRDYRNVYATINSIGLVLVTSVILMLIFVPKMVTLYRDPKGENIFKAIAPKSELIHKKKPDAERRGSLPAYLIPNKSHQWQQKAFENNSQIPNGNIKNSELKANIQPKKHCNKRMTFAVFSLTPSIGEETSSSKETDVK